MHMLKYAMPKSAKRSARIRALEKVQKILVRGLRDKALGYEQFFWRDNTAVLRSTYDLGATKPGGLLLDIGPQHEIKNVYCDDAGPHWDCNVEDSQQWESINTWATSVLRAMKTDQVEPILAEIFLQGISKWTKPDARSNTLIRGMAQEQWNYRPGLKPLLDVFLPATLTSDAWYHRAQYLSEALTTAKPEYPLIFEHHGTMLNAQHMLAWMVALTFQHENNCTNTTNEAGTAVSSRVHTHARLRREEKIAHITYEWRIIPNSDDLSELFAATCHARIVMETKKGPFTCVQPGRRMRSMLAQDNIACTAKLYDMAMGLDLPLAPSEAYILDCQRLAKLGSSGHGATSNASEVTQIIEIIQKEWWGSDNPRGAALMSAIESVYPWADMVKYKPRAALSVLTDMAAMALPNEALNPIGDSEENLFELRESQAPQG